MGAVAGEANSAEMLRGVPRSSLSLSAEAGKCRIGVKTHLCAGQMVRCMPAPGGRDGLWPPPPVIHRLPRRVAQFHPHRTSLPPARRVASAILRARPLLGFLPSPPRATAFLCRLCAAPTLLTDILITRPPDITSPLCPHRNASPCCACQAKVRHL